MAAIVADALLELEPQPLLPPHQQPAAVAMHEATRNRDLALMARLVEAQPPVLASPDVVGRSPLMMACLRGHQDCVAWLLDRGADANATDTNHRTALYNAASYGFTEVVTYLLERGADPSIGDCEGNTPLTAAAYYGYEAVVKALLAFKGNRWVSKQ
jgi:ankyrin repeat protein